MNNYHVSRLVTILVSGLGHPVHDIVSRATGGCPTSQHPQHFAIVFIEHRHVFTSPSLGQQLYHQLHSIVIEFTTLSSAFIVIEEGVIKLGWGARRGGRVDHRMLSHQFHWLRNIMFIGLKTSSAPQHRL